MPNQLDVLIIGSGAAGLNAALQLHYHGITNILILTEGLDRSTSINTGSDKQTYYKLALCGDTVDSPVDMAESYFRGGAMHGDLALVEAAVSVRAFSHLVELGVPFPQDGFGQYVGYKTDHDPRQRATSIGPYTSKVMCERMIARIQALQIPVREHCTVVELLTETGDDGQLSLFGALFVNEAGDLDVIFARDIIFAAGGPGDLYRDSVYPALHTGGIGAAFLAGALARNLPESQFGLASTAFRWNVSGTYMQVLPRVISTGNDSTSDAQEFLISYFDDPAQLYTLLFLKGYQWPFDAGKVPDGSSLLDLLIYHERVVRQRRVFLDFRQNPAGLDFGRLGTEAQQYLEKSGALMGTPIDRLLKMNPAAVELYRWQGIDLAREPLEIAVCAQHNNGGLAADRWWQSENIRHLYPVGEVNGSHGVNRPGGSALNAGQVGGIRAAEYIAHSQSSKTNEWISERKEAIAEQRLTQLRAWLALPGGILAVDAKADMRQRMSASGGILREADQLVDAVAEALALNNRIISEGIAGDVTGSIRDRLRVRQMAAAHLLYLDAIRFQSAAGVGSRGSCLVLAADGVQVHPALPEAWRKQPEEEAFREWLLVSWLDENGLPHHRWEPRRAIPVPDHWFERDWADFKAGKIFGK